jgi:hypothetical protein
MANRATHFITQAHKQPYRPAKAADPYKDFIWHLARKFTNSPEEAKAALQEIQNDIERCADTGVAVRTHEERLIARIAWRRLFNFLQ